MLGCLIFKFSVTSNNLIGSFVLPHTPTSNGHAGLPVLNRPPPLSGGSGPRCSRQRSAAGTVSARGQSAATETVAGA